MRHYPVETKLEAIRLFYEEGETRAQITEQLGILDRDRVKKWLQQYRQGGAVAFTKSRNGPRRRPQADNQEAYIARLEIENDLLKNCKPSCARICSQSAISAYCRAAGTLSAKSHVCPVRHFARGLLGLEQTESGT